MTDDVDRIDAINQAVANGDVEAFTNALHPDIVWEHNLGRGSPEEGVYEGRERVVALFRRILEPWERMQTLPDEIRETGAGAYEVTGELRAKHRLSEAEVVTRYEQRLEIRDGLVVAGAMTTGEVLVP